MTPELGYVTLVIISTSVVFPAPFRPNSPKISDLYIFIFKLSTALTWPNFFWMPTSSIDGLWHFMLSSYGYMEESTEEDYTSIYSIKFYVLLFPIFIIFFIFAQHPFIVWKNSCLNSTA